MPARASCMQLIKKGLIDNKSLIEAAGVKTIAASMRTRRQVVD
jgi:hypothetical protein